MFHVSLGGFCWVSICQLRHLLFMSLGVLLQNIYPPNPHKIKKGGEGVRGVGVVSFVLL